MLWAGWFLIIRDHRLDSQPGYCLRGDHWDYPAGRLDDSTLGK